MNEKDEFDKERFCKKFLEQIAIMNKTFDSIAESLIKIANKELEYSIEEPIVDVEDILKKIGQIGQ